MTPPVRQTSEDTSLLRSIVERGESYYVEFKSAWHFGPGGRRKRDLKDVGTDIARTVVAFANSEGGELLLGVEDDGSITGVPWEGDRLRYLVSAPGQLVRSEADLGVRVHTVEIDGLAVLWFRVPERGRDAVVTSDGRCLWRRGASSEPVSPREIQRRRDEALGDLIYESTLVPSATLADLDGDLAVTFRAGEDPVGMVTRPLGEPFAGMPMERLLRYWNLVESHNGTLHVKRAALLLFSRDPFRWHANNRIRIRRVHDQDPGFGSQLRTHEREIQGPIVRLIPQAIRALREELTVDRRVDSLFTTSQLLPRDALEECIVNAVAHRNYVVEGQAIEILLYPDRVEVISPGTLPEPITLDDLREQRGVHRSRNPLMMRVLRDLRWARDQGEGMRRIFGSMRQLELHVPELEERAGAFIVRLSTSSIYDERTQAWIAAYGPFGLLPEDRKYMVQLREAGGRLSVDRLARQLDESFDETKQHLERLEAQGLAWHPPRSRTYRLVESTVVPHERALRTFDEAGVAAEGQATFRREDLEVILGAGGNESVFQRILTRWQQAGILEPAGRGRWRVGTSFLEYLSRRRAER